MKLLWWLTFITTIISNVVFSQFNWKSYFTLKPDEGTSFVIDTTALVTGGGVPVINITNTEKIILTTVIGPSLQAFEVCNNGKIYTPVTNTQRGPDGGFVYLSDGRTRFLSEEPDPTKTSQRHKSRIVSWISLDGINWIKEDGVRYQPSINDDYISSVVSVIQVQDSIWRMYYVGDWYRTNGIRTAISKDWGWSWQQESQNNILRRGDVDPHPVYLTNGKIRLYFRTGFNSSDTSKRGIAYCESDNGLDFDTLQTKLLILDSSVPNLLKLDPWVIKFPNGAIACYFGAVPSFENPNQNNSGLFVAWQPKATKFETFKTPSTFKLFQNYPNPFNIITTIRFSLPKAEYVSIKVYNVLGNEIAVLVNKDMPAGENSVVFNAKDLPSGVYFYRLNAGDNFCISQKCLCIK